MSGVDGAPADGGPWHCPHCDQPTETNYRCSNPGCGRDLTDRELTPMTALPKPGDSERPYRRVLGIIHCNTGDPQPVTIKQPTFWTKVKHTPVAKADAAKALRAARENDHVFRHKDDAGEIRYGLTPAGVAELPDAAMPIYAPEDEAALRDTLGTENSRPNPNALVTESIATHIQSLPDGGESDE